MKNYIITVTIILCTLQFNAQGMIFTENITATKSYAGVFGTASIQIDDAGNDGMITRPLIVAEGFESGLLGQENEFGENNIEEFIEDLEESRSADLRNLLTNQTEFVYGDQDYDIIYVNWDNPRANLQLNAYVLEEVINWVNSEKTSNADQNVVLGQSMGGVIARYALADMEQTPNLDHDTKLYISHDALHQGANIPLGIQYLARHLADQFVGTPLGDFSFEVSNDSEASIEEINALFNEPGTQQLLANYITPNFAHSTSEFDAFQTDLQSKGYPILTRNIAISNGSHCANTQEYAYNASLFRMNGNARTGVLADLLGSFLSIADDIALAILFDEPALILGVLPGSSQFNLDFNAKALPLANTTANIYKGKVSYTKKLLWFININVNLTDRSYNNPVSLSYDKYAGGRYELFDQVNDIDFFDDDNDFNGDGEPDITQFHADLLNVLIGSANIDFNTEQTFGFIPVPSALDVGGGTTVLNDGHYFRTYNAATPPTGNLSIPFHNFITAYLDDNSLNEQHISFNFRNGDWLATELDIAIGNEEVFDCSYVCNGVRISGSSSVCFNSSETYSIPAFPAAANAVITWSISPAGGFTLTPNGNSVTVAPNGNFSGEATLMVSVDTDCGTVDAEKTIQTGSQRPILYDSNGNEVASLNFPLYTWESITFTTPPGTLEWEWEKVSGNFTLMANNTNYAQVYASQNTSGIVTVRIRDNCGWGPVTFLSLSFGSGGGGFGFRTTSGSSSPSLSLEIIEGDTNINRSKTANASSVANEKTKGTYAIMVADMYGATLYKAQHIKQKKVDIKKEKWPKGIYFVRVSNNKGEVQTKGVVLN